MSRQDRCACNRPAVCWKSGSPCCAVCRDIEDRMPSDYHPNHPHKYREHYDTVWSAQTQRMVARGFADWCVRERSLRLLLNP